MKKNIFVFMFFLLSIPFVFAYGDMSGAEYAGKEYDMDLYYSIDQLRSAWRQVNRGTTVYEIEKLTTNEERLLGEAISEYRVEKGDIYTVQIGEVSTNPMRILKLVVRINKVYNNGKNWSYTWWSIGKIYWY